MIVVRSPHPALAPFVRRGYIGYDIAAEAPNEQLELPHAGIVLIVGLGPAIMVDGAAQSSFVAGLYQRPVTIADGGRQAGMQAFLTPLGARALLRRPMRELTAQTVALDDVIATDLPEQLASLETWDARFAAFEGFLARRVAAAPGPRPDVAHAWARLEAAHGALSIGTLCEELGCSRRHLAARFGEEIGLAPKAYARVLRFERATALLRAGTQPAATAAACGYADQAHLSREFRSLAGTAPGAWAKTAAVTNLQDATAAAV